jgi:hypothetical protein
VKDEEPRKEMAQEFVELRKVMVALGKEMADMHGTMKATFWIISGATSVATIAGVVVGIGKALDWF